jgi:hypothetical protein
MPEKTVLFQLPIVPVILAHCHFLLELKGFGLCVGLNQVI